MIHKFINRFVEIVKDLGRKDWIFYGNDNLLPNKLIRYVNESGTAKTCIAKIAEYIEADGFVSDVVSYYQFNKNQNGDAVLSDVCLQMSMFSGFAVLVKRNGFDLPKEIEVLPLEKIRKAKDKKGFYYNANVGNKNYRETEWQFYPQFSRSNKNVVAEYPQGEIAYFFRKSAENPYYPIPDYYAGIEDVITSAELSKMDLELAWNGFMTTGFLTFIGDPNQVVEGEHNMTLRQYYDAQLDEFTGSVKDEQGMSGRMSLLTFWARMKEEVPVLQSFDPKAIIDASNVKRDMVNREVCRLFKVHPVLIGFSDAAVLGNQQSLSNAQKMLIEVVSPMQRFITDSLAYIFPEMDFTISQKSPLMVADPALLVVLTEDEIRDMFWGLKPKLKQNDNNENTTENIRSV
jgi:hypothetical protein